MSSETLQHLNTNVLIGNTDHRGHAWHYKADQQGTEPNHYAGAIPVADVQRRLFQWVAESRRMAMEVPAELETMTHLAEDGNPVRWAVQADLQGIARSDNHHRMGVFTPGYERHQYGPWLLDTVGVLLDDDLGISSAGLLREGAIAWVEVSVPESIETPEGVTFRPNLLATTSFDGSIATTFKRTVTDTVCDNTREMALSERGQAYKVKHSRYSKMKITEAREALQMIHSLADEFAAEIAQLCAIEVSQQQWARFLDAHVPLVDEKDAPLTKRSLGLAEAKRGALSKLYRYDTRVAPWAGTAHGVLQAVNTYEHHENSVRGGDRAERNMLRTVTGEFGNLDRQTWASLTEVLASATF
jgi:phage/plasmid-like protein (TIGR03299 family)